MEHSEEFYKRRSDGRIKNEIGHIMRTYNVIEYKSPEDALTIDDYYKTVGYAYLYKGYGEHVDAVPIDELTVSIFRATRPEKMFLTLQKYGHKIEEFLRNVEGMNTPRDRQNVEAVLQVSVKANDELYCEIRRDANMCDALRELMKDDLEDARKMGEAKGKAEGKIMGEAKIILKMNHSGMSPENIASITGKDLDEICAILEGKVSALL